MACASSSMTESHSLSEMSFLVRTMPYVVIVRNESPAEPLPWATDTGMSGANLAISLCQFPMRDAGTTSRCLPPAVDLIFSR